MDQGWEESQQWYDTLVGTHGHYYHEQVILPQLLPLLDFKTPHFSLLDIGCGQGILARAIPAHTHYLGIDASPSLIAQAKKRSSHQFLVHDATLPFPFTQRFTHAVMLLSLQNMPLEPTLFHSCQALLSQGSLILVLNHPCFRIPRQSSWMVDTTQKIQYRRINRYLKPLRIPITTHTSSQQLTTYSYHHCLQDISKALHQSSMAITSIYEWISNKKSTGKYKAMEDRAREEFPLFMTIVAKKLI